MNRHYTDSYYYAKRVIQHLRAGLSEDLAPAEIRVRQALGQEPEPEMTRVERILAEIREAETTAEGEAKKALAAARKRIESIRRDETKITVE